MFRKIGVSLGCTEKCSFGNIKTVPLNGDETVALAAKASGGSEIPHSVRDPNASLYDKVFTMEYEPDNGFRVPLHIEGLDNLPWLVRKRISLYNSVHPNSPFTMSCPGSEQCPHAGQIGEFAAQLSMNGVVDNGKSG